jgi:hypothetical protein
METWKVEPCATVAGELAEAVKASWLNPVGPAKVKFVVTGDEADDPGDNAAIARPEAAASAAAAAATSRRARALKVARLSGRPRCRRCEAIWLSPKMISLLPDTKGAWVERAEARSTHGYLATDSPKRE